MIGFFDSGLGGLAVMRAFIRRFPKMNRVFFADRANCPYGERSPEEILLLTQDGIDILKEKWAKVVIIACNTATVHALEALKKRSGIPLFWVTDAGVRAVCAHPEWKRIWVVATTATVASWAYRDRIRMTRPDIEVFEVAAPALVPIVEAGLEDSNKAMREVRAACSHLPNDLNAVVLGCTHYPFLLAHFQAALGPIAIVDPGEELVDDYISWLNSHANDPTGASAQEATFWGSGEERYFES